jgi:molybdopterin-containing oxidoreductase family iron-sulfur binding subunit
MVVGFAAPVTSPPPAVDAARVAARVGGLKSRAGFRASLPNFAAAASAVRSIADHASAVSRAHADARSFAVLAELGTVPRTRYLAKIENPNPELRR